MTKLVIRSARQDEPSAIATVHRAAFGRSDEANLALALIEDGDAALSLFAEEDGTVLGNVLYSRVEGTDRALALAPVGVLPKHQGKGLGSALIETSLEMARIGGWRSVFVLGEPAYYGRFGFSADLAAGAGTPWSGPYLQAIELAAGNLQGFRSSLRYAPAFMRM